MRRSAGVTDDGSDARRSGYNLGMMRAPLAFAASCTLWIASGCTGDDGDPATTVADSSTAGPGTTAADTAMGSEESTAAPDSTGVADSSTGQADGATTMADDADSSGGASSTGVVDDGVITFDEVQPLFSQSCSPCHTNAMFGGHNVGDSDPAMGYADSQLDAMAGACAGLTVGACTLVRIQSGEMPMGFGCTGDPKMDAGDEACLTADEQALIQTWIDDGQLAPL